jgi:DNA-binding transcriptional LysR family regulator
VQLAFVCAPGHPLARAREPIGLEELRRHRRIATADTSRVLAPRSAGISDVQDTLTLASMQAKLEAHAAGLGVGFVPRNRAAALLAQGLLVEKRVAEAPSGSTLCLAWRTRESGRALHWFAERLMDPRTSRALTGVRASR